MTWWLRVCRAARRRFDAWRQQRADDRAWRHDVHDRNEAFDESFWDLIATPEDHANGPFDPVTRIPRQGRGRHRKGES